MQMRRKIRLNLFKFSFGFTLLGIFLTLLCLVKNSSSDYVWDNKLDKWVWQENSNDVSSHHEGSGDNYDDDDNEGSGYDNSEDDDAYDDEYVDEHYEDGSGNSYDNYYDENSVGDKRTNQDFNHAAMTTTDWPVSSQTVGYSPNIYFAKSTTAQNFVNYDDITDVVTKSRTTTTTSTTILSNTFDHDNEILDSDHTKVYDHKDRTLPFDDDPKSNFRSKTSFFAQPGMLAAVVGGAVVGLLCAILCVMFIVYRMRKKDEGSYALDEPRRNRNSTVSYGKKSAQEFFA